MVCSPHTRGNVRCGSKIGACRSCKRQAQTLEWHAELLVSCKAACGTPQTSACPCLRLQRCKCMQIQAPMQSFTALPVPTQPPGFCRKHGSGRLASTLAAAQALGATAFGVVPHGGSKRCQHAGCDRSAGCNKLMHKAWWQTPCGLYFIARATEAITARATRADPGGEVRHTTQPVSASRCSGLTGSCSLCRDPNRVCHLIQWDERPPAAAAPRSCAFAGSTVRAHALHASACKRHGARVQLEHAPPAAAARSSTSAAANCSSARSQSFRSRTSRFCRDVNGSRKTISWFSSLPRTCRTQV